MYLTLSLSLSLQFHNTLIVKSLAQGEAPCSSQYTVDATTTAGSNNPVGDLLISSLGNVSKLRKTNLSMSDKRDFILYYESRQKGKK